MFKNKIGPSDRAVKQFLNTFESWAVRHARSALAPTYQWHRGARGVTTNPVGANSATFTTPAMTSTHTYWVRISNGCGSIDSAAATVTVQVRRRGARRG
jgi:hypothetical protein